MSAHEGVSCDACGKSNFRSKRYKCLICYDYDLCSTCYEQGEASSHHTNEHPMQCILTRQDFDFYYHGERFASDQAQSFTCPFCGEMGFSLPFINESSSSSSQNFDLFHHLQLKHADEQQSNEVICPICAAMINGEPNLVTADLLSHIANEHQHQQVQTPSTPGIGINPYSRQSSSSNRESDFTTGTSTRAGFRRGPLRTPGRRGGLGRGGGTVSQHFVVDPSAVNGGSDPIADLLTQLSTVRRLAAANNNNNNSSSANTISLQTLTRQQYERERLRATGRSHHQQQQSHHSQQAVSSSNNLPSIENDFFDSLFASALFIDSSSSSNNTHQTWAQIVAQQQQSTPEQQQQQQQQSSTTTKTTTIEPDPSLLRRLCDETSSLTQQNNSVVQQQKCKNDFVHSLLFASFVCPFNDKDK